VIRDTERLTKMKYSHHIPWERQHFNLIRIPCCVDSIKCKFCGKVFIDKRESIPCLMKHLKEEHNITELSNYPYRNDLRQKFIINEESSKATCFICQHEIKYDEHGLYLLKNHFEIYHGNSSHTYKVIVRTEKGCDTLDKYFIMGIEATCPKCGTKIDMTHSETHAVEKVKTLLEHYFSHYRYKKKVLCFTSLFTLLKRAKHDFILLLLLYNFIIIRYQRYYDWNQFSIKIVNYCYTYKCSVI